MPATALRTDDWRDTLARLCEQRAEMQLYRKTFDEGIDSLNDEIRAILSAHDLSLVEVPGYEIVLITAQRSALSVERLLELGVSTGVVAQATKTTPVVSLRVTAVS